MYPRPPVSTRTAPLFPHTTLLRSALHRFLMPPDPPSHTRADQPLWPTLRRFLPYLWPAGEPHLKLRIVAAMLLVLASKLVQVFGAAYTLKYAVDRMAAGDRGLATLVILLVVGYAAARFSTTLLDRKSTRLNSSH